MISFPNAKINLGLKVVSKRPDGYHNLDTVFFPIPFYDILEIIPNAELASRDVTFTTSGKKISGESSSNLCVKAYNLIKQDFPRLKQISVHLHKNIPMGAGMGGGSADGAFMIKMLNEKFLLELDEDKMKSYALQLGSDCPFFISNKPSHATGRGELLTEINCDLSDKTLLIVNPGIHVSTAEAFGKINISANSISTAEIVKQPISTWRGSLENDFEKTVFQHHPEIKKIKDTLYERGALYASMTGSGSTVYGIFDASVEENIFPKNNYEIIEIKDGKSFQK